MKMLTIKIPFKTPTINHLHGHNKWGAFYLKPEAKKLKVDIAEAIGAYPLLAATGLIGKNLKVTIEVHEDWYCKNGSVKRKDIANREKFLVDAVFDRLTLEDKFIFDHQMKKIQDKEEFAIVKIEAIDETLNRN